MRLIDADELIEIINYTFSKPPFSRKTIKNMIDMARTVDAVPVIHEKWIDIDEQSYTWKIRCSCCNHERSMMSTQCTYPNYCENCGARMDEE